MVSRISNWFCTSRLGVVLARGAPNSSRDGKASTSTSMRGMPKFALAASATPLSAKRVKLKRASLRVVGLKIRLYVTVAAEFSGWNGRSPMGSPPLLASAEICLSLVKYVLTAMESFDVGTKSTRPLY